MMGLLRRPRAPQPPSGLHRAAGRAHPPRTGPPNRPGSTPSPPPDAAASARALARALRQRGQRRVYGVADARVSVVSTPQATVWCRGGVLSWRDAMGWRVQILAEEIEAAVGLLLEQAHQPTAAM